MICSSEDEKQTQLVVTHTTCDRMQNTSVPPKLNTAMNTKNCLSEENIFQACILKKQGIYGCENEMERYNECRYREMEISVREEQKKENAEFHKRYRNLTQ
jgi:hypothetical protein